jgi:dTDP-3-amino-3,4,6-trideoxy-alpha-D-glucose transaminase
VVPVVDLSRRGARFAAAFGVVAERIARSGQYLLGHETARLEADFAAATGARHAVAVSSGAAALQLSLEALGPQGEVVVPAFTAVPTASAVIAAGGTPVFADVDADTACLDHEALHAVLGERTTAVVVVHLYGYPSDVPPVAVPVVEDAAQAHGALRRPSRSAATAYSFYPTKNLGGIGDGGAIVTQRAELADRVRLLRAHGMTSQYVHEEVAQNFRLSELEAAWLTIALPELRTDVARRRAIAAHYRAAAPHLGWQRTHADHVYHLCVFRAADRPSAVAQLAAAGVATAAHYPLALTEQPAYRRFATVPCPTAEAWAASCVTVPCFPEMTDAEVEHVATALAGLEG